MIEEWRPRNRNGSYMLKGEKMKYEPRPIDTSEVRLPRELSELTEKLAGNSHDNWARQRLAEGWRYGPNRDDDRREHPDLVPYDELPESEKEYDRTTAMETLKAIVVLGYSIEKPAPASAPEVNL